MKRKNTVVMSSVKGSILVNTVPTKKDVDYNRIYVFNDPTIVENTFKFYDDNRILNKSHIKEIRMDIDKAPYKAKYFAPIRIDINTMGIADGQHRVSAFIKAWKEGSLEEMRVIFEDYPIDNSGNDRMSIIARINGTNKNWGINDHQHRLLSEDHKSMKTIEEFGKTHSLCQKKNSKGEVVGFYPRYAYAILFGRNMTTDVKNGSISVSNSEIEFGNKLHDELHKLIDVLNYEMNSWFESFAHAWYNIRKTDKAYSTIIDNLGIDTICEHISDEFEGYQIITRKAEWERRIRTAIWEINRTKK